jgi:hypothetical protein
LKYFFFVLIITLVKIQKNNHHDLFFTGYCSVGKEFENKLPQLIKEFVKVHGFDTIDIEKEQYMAIRVDSAEVIQNVVNILPFSPNAQLEIKAKDGWVYVKGNAPDCYWLWRLLEPVNGGHGRWGYTFICDGIEKIQGSLQNVTRIRSASPEEFTF